MCLTLPHPIQDSKRSKYEHVLSRRHHMYPIDELAISQVVATALNCYRSIASLHELTRNVCIESLPCSPTGDGSRRLLMLAAMQVMPNSGTTLDLHPMIAKAISIQDSSFILNFWPQRHSKTAVSTRADCQPCSTLLSVRLATGSSAIADKSGA